MIEMPNDFAIEWDGQVYKPSGCFDHTKIDGTIVQLLSWLTACPSCGKEFHVFTTATFRGPRRRCDLCKAPGKPVRSGRKLLAAQIRGDAA